MVGSPVATPIRTYYSKVKVDRVEAKTLNMLFLKRRVLRCRGEGGIMHRTGSKAGAKSGSGSDSETLRADDVLLWCASKPHMLKELP
jgi:hypothetical protein